MIRFILFFIELKWVSMGWVSFSPFSVRITWDLWWKKCHISTSYFIKFVFIINYQGIRKLKWPFFIWKKTNTWITHNIVSSQDFPHSTENLLHSLGVFNQLGNFHSLSLENQKLLFMRQQKLLVLFGHIQNEDVVQYIE